MENKEAMTKVDADFLNEFAGAGLDKFTGAALSTPFLSMVQPDSNPALAGHKPGTWRNSATDENYGDLLRVIPLAFDFIWNERDMNTNPPGMTVGRYKVGSIKIDTQMPKPGQRGYPKMINAETGNEVQELFVYALMLPDHPDAGVLMFNPTVGVMRACRSWNNQISSALLPNGKHAPVFGYSWLLGLALEPNPKKPGGQVARIKQIKRDALVDKDFFMQQVKPQITFVQQTLLQFTSSTAEDVASIGVDD